MRHILVAAHGSLASAIGQSVKMIYGEVENLKCMDFFTEADAAKTGSEAIDYDKRISEYFAALDEADEVIICTDLKEGSVSQKFLPYCTRPGVHMIAGVNLPAVLEVAICDEPITKTTLAEIVNIGREQMASINMENISCEEQEEFF